MLLIHGSARSFQIPSEHAILPNIVSSSNLMISNGERLLENLINFKFLLILIKSVLLNKQMFISLAILLIILSKYIHVDKSLNKITINKTKSHSFSIKQLHFFMSKTEARIEDTVGLPLMSPYHFEKKGATLRVNYFTYITLRVH